MVLKPGVDRMEAELEPAVNNPEGLSIEKAIDYVTRAREYAINDDGENMFVLIWEIWNEAQSKLKK